MAHISCAHCGVEITDHSTLVERDGQSYCCNNCASMAVEQEGPAGLATCAHCQMPIMDTSTMVQRDGTSFCCNNCATAMAAGAGREAR